ncbi:hypothetical protein [Roseateles asaccharophilus]|uniref:Uncharacterized protein n=1 Tax=Roseateles asaccharophilus TaxID=582607 RepID=A0ABU2A299_9BURK|nr:hypothetical protein [Roseateles asaccharophilus]MDR7331301.1 hypothetical protein [Roseateles asaccharophilus]
MHHRWLARGLVIALHAGVLTALWLHRGPPREQPSERRLTTVRLLSPDRPAPRAPQATPRPQPEARVPALTAPRTPDLPDEPAPVSTAITAPAPEAPPPAEPPRTALRLTLPPGYAASSAAARNPALSDPRSNTARLTLEERIADATGGAGAWVEEPKENHSQVVGALGDRRTVLRKGNTCVEVFRSRIADTDPFNANVAPRTVAMQGKAYKCR